MTRDSKRQDTCAFDFDRVDQWGPELIEVFQRELPKKVRRIFAADPPDDVEHATEILIPHMAIEKLAIEKRVRKWFEEKRVLAYHGDRMTDEDLDRWPSFRSDARQLARLEAACGTHPQWNVVRGRAPEMLLNLTTRLTFKRSASASKRGAILSFNTQLPAETEVLRRVALDLLGAEGAQMVLRYGEPRVLQLELLGVNALRAANRFANRRVLDQNYLVWETFNAWAYWLADREFTPAAEGWFVGLDLPIGEDNWRVIGSDSVKLPG